MTFSLDPEIAEIFVAMARHGTTRPAPKRGDWKGLRDNGNAAWALWSSLAPSYPEVQRTTYFATAPDGTAIELRWYAKGDAAPGSAVVYAHGGGMILGNLDVYDFVVSEYVAATSVPFLSVDYRLAPEAKGEMPARDVFAGITWLVEHASELSVDPDRIAVMGDSGGGGPAAGAAIMARDGGIKLAGQILIYPMLDDRNQTPDPRLSPFATWTYDNNFTAWSALLGNNLGGEKVSSIAVPARLGDSAGLAPAYIEVGELDIFRNEDIAYAQNLAKGGVSVELHVHPGAPHGYDRLAPKSQLTRRAMADRLRSREGDLDAR